MDKFGKIRRHHWKECRKISKFAKFESDLLKTNNNNNFIISIALLSYVQGANDDKAPQSREILQTFV